MIPADELKDLQGDQECFNPPANYISVWVPITSPAEKIARAKEQLSSECKEASGAETSGKDTDSNDVVTESKSKREELNKETGLTPMMSSLNVGPGGDKVKPKQKRVRKMSKGKVRGSSSSDGNVTVADRDISTTVDAPGSKDSTVKSGNDESQVEAGDCDVGKMPDTRCNILTSPSKPESPGEIDNSEVKVATGSSKKKDKKSPVKVKTPEKNGDSVGE